jgi:hypothetical protein
MHGRVGAQEAGAREGKGAPGYARQRERRGGGRPGVGKGQERPPPAKGARAPYRARKKGGAYF